MRAPSPGAPLFNGLAIGSSSAKSDPAEMDFACRSFSPKENVDRNGDAAPFSRPGTVNICPVDWEDGPVTDVSCLVMIEEELSGCIDVGILVQL